MVNILTMIELFKAQFTRINRALLSYLHNRFIFNMYNSSKIEQMSGVSCLS